MRGMDSIYNMAGAIGALCFIFMHVIFAVIVVMLTLCVYLIIPVLAILIALKIAGVW